MSKFLVFGDLEAIEKRDDIKGFFKRNLLGKVKVILEVDKICESCGECDLRIVEILKNEDGKKVLVWISEGDCLGITTLLTDVEGELIYE